MFLLVIAIIRGGGQAIIFLLLESICFNSRFGLGVVLGRPGAAMSFLCCLDSGLIIGYSKPDSLRA